MPTFGALCAHPASLADTGARHASATIEAAGSTAHLTAAGLRTAGLGVATVAAAVICMILFKITFIFGLL